jgi:hypothetical protein
MLSYTLLERNEALLRRKQFAERKKKEIRGETESFCISEEDIVRNLLLRLKLKLYTIPSIGSRNNSNSIVPMLAEQPNQNPKYASQ